MILCIFTGTKSIKSLFLLFLSSLSFHFTLFCRSQQTPEQTLSVRKNLDLPESDPPNPKSAIDLGFLLHDLVLLHSPMLPSSSSSSPSLLLILTISVLLSRGNPNPNPIPSSNPSFSILNYRDYDHDHDHDYDYDYHFPPPPLPPPPPPLPDSSCPELAGECDIDTLCELRSSVNFTGDVTIAGNGSFYVLPGVTLACPVPGCTIFAHLGGSFRLGENSTVVAGSVQLAVRNMSVAEGAALNTTGLGGDPPERTSGAGTGIHGDGGGHGGRGASCYVKDGEMEDDAWGGDVYAWDTLTKPMSYGSRGGTTSLEKEYGGGGGGRVMLLVKEVLEVDGVISADGGDGGILGGGGSGGSIYIDANKM